MYKVDNFTLSFDVIADDHYWSQQIKLDDSVPLERIFIRNIIKGDLSVTNQAVVDALKKRLLSYLGTMYEIT